MVNYHFILSSASWSTDTYLSPQLVQKVSHRCAQTPWHQFQIPPYSSCALPTSSLIRWRKEHRHTVLPSQLHSDRLPARIFRKCFCFRIWRNQIRPSLRNSWFSAFFWRLQAAFLPVCEWERSCYWKNRRFRSPSGRQQEKAKSYISHKEQPQLILLSNRFPQRSYLKLSLCRFWTHSISFEQGEGRIRGVFSCRLPAEAYFSFFLRWVW